MGVPRAATQRTRTNSRNENSSPDGVHQQNDADLCQQFKRSEILNRWPWREWTNQDAAHDVAEDQGLPQLSRQQPTYERGNENVRKITIEDGVLSHPVPQIAVIRLLLCIRRIRFVATSAVAMMTDTLFVVGTWVWAPRRWPCRHTILPRVDAFGRRQCLTCLK